MLRKNVLVPVLFLTSVAVLLSSCNGPKPPKITESNSTVTDPSEPKLTPITITSPSTLNEINNASSINVSGTCVTGAVVTAVVGSATQNTTCAGGTFSFNFSQSSDGVYNYSFAQSSNAKNVSSAVNFRWTKDTVAPAAIVITSPSVNPYISSDSSVNVSGNCEINSSVNMSGDATGATTCTSGAFTLNISKSVDGIYNVNVTQTDLAGNTSTAAAFTWQRDTVAPAAPLVSTPAANPYISADSNLNISGSCENGAAVSISGSAFATVICAAGSYNFTAIKAVDDTYNFLIDQTDAAGNISGVTNLQWIRDASIPATPVISAPASSPIYTNTDLLIISGSCVSGYNVELSGDLADSVICVSSAFSFSITKTTDFSYSFDIKQKNLANTYSAAATVNWIRDTVAPSTPTVTNPSSSPYYSNANSVTLSGACDTGATVNLAGATSNSTTCTASAYSFNVNESSNGSYDFIISQTDLAGNASGTILRTWVRDTVAPAPISIVNPATNPFASGDTNLNIIGSCEAGLSTVTMSGDASGTVNCSVFGQFTFAVTQSVDGTYNYNFIQTDLAGNASSSVAFQWIRDTSVPVTPIITVPVASPYNSNTNTITITATCESALSPAVAVVNLGGDVVASDVTSPAGSLSQDCDSSPVTFIVQKVTDGTYNFTISQDNPNASTSSASASVQWVRDTVVPAAPVITNPASSPFIAPGNLTISGNCEVNASVVLSGDNSQNQICSLAGTFSFSVIKTTDATYNFSLVQTDIAGNNSSSTNLQWIRDSNSVPAPIITTPSSSPYLGNLANLTISGTCSSGYLLTLYGDVAAADVASPAGSLTQICSGGGFTFVVNKTVDNTYNLSLKQTFNSVDSAAANLVWNRDTTAPLVSITANPPSPNMTTSASFSFSVNEVGSTFECALDAGAYSTCTSPKSYSSLTNASHTFYVRAIDPAGNVSASQSNTWTQAAYNTMALYHLNNSSPTTDSGNYTQVAGFMNTLTQSGTTSNDTTGKYPTGSATSRSFGTNNYYSVNDNNSLNLGTNAMTVEGFVKFTTSISTTGNYYTLVSKTGSASPNFGWEVRLRKSSSTRYALDFVGSLNGTSAGTVVSSNNITLSANTWYYFAVTWNLGTVNFYLGTTSATSRGSRVIGTAGSSVLATTTSPLRLGANASSGTGTSLWFVGSLDEVRISQMVRTIVFPSTEFSAD